MHGWRSKHSEWEKMSQPVSPRGPSPDDGQQDHQRYRLLAEMATDLVVQTGPDGAIEWLSPSVTEVLGWTQDDLLGTRLSGLMHPADLRRQLELRARLLDGEKLSGTVTARFRTAGGEYRWLSGSGRALTDATGAVIGGVDSLRDVHDEHLSREALAEEHRRLLATWESMLDPHVLLTLPDGPGRLPVVQAANDAALRALGRHRDAVIQRPIDQVFPADDSRAVAEWCDAVVAQDGALRLSEAPLQVSPNAAKRFFDVAAVAVDETISLTWRDVTDQALTTQRLAASERLFRTAMESSAIGMSLTDRSGRLMAVNPALCELFGMSEETLRHMSWTELTHPDDIAAEAVLLAEVMAGETDHYHLVKRFVRADGTVGTGDLNVTSVCGDDGAVTHVIAQLTDITERLELESEVRRSEANLRLLAEHSSDVLARIEADDTLLWISPSITEHTDRLPDEVTGSRFASLVLPSDLTAWRRMIERATTNGSARGELRLLSRSGDPVWFDLRCVAPPTPADTRPGQIIMIGRNIEDELRSRRAAAVRESDLMTIAETAADFIMRLNLDGEVTWVSESITQSLDAKPADLVGRGIRSLLEPDDRQRLERELRRISSAARFQRLIRARSRSGPIWCAVTGTPTSDVDGRRTGWLISARLVDDEVATFDRLASDLDAMTLDLHSAAGAIAVCDATGTLVDINDAMAALADVPREDLIGTQLAQLVDPADRTELSHALDRVREDSVPSAIIELTWRRREPTWVQLTIGRALRTDPDAAVRLIIQASDMTHLKRGRAELEHAATHDALTRLLNRRGLEAAMMNRAGNWCVLFLDLDGFKDINDRFGHAVGDRALVQVSAALQEAVRSGDLTARLGGDEFVVVLDGVADEATAQSVAEDIRQRVSGSPAAAGVTTTVGLALAAPGESFAAALHRADGALYEAKQAGRNQVRAAAPISH